MPEIHPAHGASFASNGDHGGRDMTKEPEHGPRDLAGKRIVRRHQLHLDVAPRPGLGVEAVEIVYVSRICGD